MGHEAGSDLVVHATQDPSVRVVEFRDRYLNYERADDLKPLLRDLVEHELGAGGRLVILDLSLLGVIDSCGLAILVSAGKQVRLAGGELALCGLSDMIRRLFELTGLDRVFEIHESVSAAVAAVAEDRVA